MFRSKPKMDIRDVKNIQEGLKGIYKNKVKPTEEHYMFTEFHSTRLMDSDFDAKPMVLLLGQYSTGKTSFINFLIEREFPGSHIGPEPTTDKFIAVMHNREDRVTPGNAVAVQPDKPFRGLEMFGGGFLSKFQASECNAPLLEEITFIDTPGVQAGEKQRSGRGYDFTQVASWFAERADLILLLFDCHKLDISDEFKKTIECLRGHDDKIRVVLNKSDMVNTQQLMRVYGALMWSLGKVIRTPEVARVYIGSFWANPLHYTENAPLFQAEQADLLRDLRNLPSNAMIRKVNELVKRTRQARVHAIIISHLRKQMPAMFGKSTKQEELLADMRNVFEEIQRANKLPAGDFPDPEKFVQLCRNMDFSKHFNKYNAKLINSLTEVLDKDLPALMTRFPPEVLSGEKAGNSADVILSTDMGFANRITQGGINNPNPLARDAVVSPSASRGSALALPAPAAPADPWAVSASERSNLIAEFHRLNPPNGLLSGGQAKEVLLRTGLDNESLKRIWFLSDADQDGFLSQDEYVAALVLARGVRSGMAIPHSLPASLQSGGSSNPF
ncbi:hypothetical protein H696_00638 [Fonticula alba]|uniref:EF-hand domain-containing protein n=1 Tax=Fonticula alba TaxID=691883 RepID=A0A058ZGN3_FONAL|nr:hypothetical protein H696_00638 [Fonticula alba]KCV73093.1 hypothetical protein H696_00638 [Fonticula alba]|eukprot:XP_009492794.1 hypothetical protein H696_00638 [Fonticula alba]